MTTLTRRQAAKLGVGDGYDSDLEAEFAFHLRALGVPAWERGYHFDDTKRHFDFAWPAQHVAAEVNGEAVHGHWGKQREDAQKRNDAQALGWVVLTFTGRMIRSDPLGCIEQVKRALEGTRL